MLIIDSCLYHTINILLHRPILCSRALLKTRQEAYDKSHLVQCMASATTILSLFDLYRRTFGDNHVVLSLAYSIYTAASIFLLEIQALKYAAPGTLDKLKFCIIALERVKGSNPVITTALSLVYQELQKLQIDIHITMPAPQNTDKEHPHPQHQPQPQHYHPLHETQPNQSPPISNSPSHHDSSTRHHQYEYSQQRPQTTMTSTNPPSTSITPSDSVLPTYPTYQQQRQQQPVADFELSQTSHITQMPPTHLLGGIPNAVMTVDDPGAYEITPEVFEAFSYAQPISTNMTSFEAWNGPAL